MSNKLQTLLERMPQHFAHSPDSNNYKLLSIIAENGNENKLIFDTILKFWNVDQSEGVGLDRLGKDEGISRGNWTDKEYRKMIKIQCIINLSEGDIPTMNTILEAYLGDDFLGLEEGWVRYNKPASLVVETKPSEQTLPFDLLQKIKTAGVGLVYVEIVNPNETLFHTGSIVLTGEVTTIYPWYSNEPIEATLKVPISPYSQDIETITLFPKGVD